MNLVMTLLVRDEEDIIASNIEFHLSRGVDHILAMDNLSQDLTPHILNRYQREGRLTYLHQPDDDYSQGLWVTEMARKAYCELQADWVINGDADEFWWPRSGSLKDVLATVPAAADAVRVERVNFIPPSIAIPPGIASSSSGGSGFRDDTASFAADMTVRERRSFNALGRPLPPKVCHRGFGDVSVGQGNHDAWREGRPLATTDAPIEILHFPLRSYAQFSRKIASGGAAYRRNQSLPETIGDNWRRLHELQLRGELGQAYDAQVRDEVALAEGLASGELVQDLRLRDALVALGGA